MRDIDPEPIRQKMALWAQGLTGHEALHHLAEKWRERLMTEPDAITAFVSTFSELDIQKVSKMIDKAKQERAKQLSPVAYRQLFRLVRDCLIDQQNAR
jgi:ribosome-associated protein